MIVKERSVSPRHAVRLEDAEFAEIQHMIFTEAGIHMPVSKKVMIAGRLAKRLNALNLTNYGDYGRLLRIDRAEKQIAVDLLTTNETYFFREAKHFAFLGNHIAREFQHREPFRLWSAACSSGEEPYTAAMVLASVMGEKPWNILASDISTQMLTKARRGCYRMAQAEKIPTDQLKRFCLRGTGEAEGSFMVNPSLRSRVKVEHINLNLPLSDRGLFDVIFLRNVMIYFNADTKQQVVSRLVSRLRPGGYFIIGHSETLNGIQDGLVSVMPSVYRAKLN